MRWAEVTCDSVWESRGMADFVVRVWMCVSTSWTSKRTRDKGVARSRGVSEGLFVVVTRVFAKE